jgi:hypothetical protein
MLQLEGDKARQREEPEARKQAAAEAPAWQPGTKRKNPSEATNTDAQSAYPPPRHPRDNMYDITVGQPCRKQLVIYPHPINPHTDIKPTGNFEVVVRHVLRYCKDKTGGSQVTEPKACIHQPDGRCTHTLPVETAAQLYQRFEYVQTHHEQVHTKLNAGTFAEELSKLICRYTDGTVCSGKGENTYMIDTRNQRSMSLAVRNMLHNTMGGAKERFASPLNVADSCSEYWSAHKQDQVFRAHNDTYKTRWTGASTACPDFTESQAEKAALWALHSAVQAQTPTLTLLLLPTFSKYSQKANYRKVFESSPDLCKQLATIPSGMLTLEKSPLAPATQSQRLKWNMHIFAVGNIEGDRQYLPYWKSSINGIWRERFRRALEAALRPTRHPRTARQKFRCTTSTQHGGHQNQKYRQPRQQARQSKRKVHNQDY